MKHLLPILGLCFLLLAGGFIMPDTASAQSCCVGLRGNVNADEQDNVDISDLTALVNNLFVTFEPLPCPEEANTNGDENETIDISDLTALVNNLFVTFEPLPACPAPSNVVFQDEYGPRTTYQAFGGSKLDAVQIDVDSTYAGPQGLVITIPDAGDPSGGYSGGAFTDSVGRDLSGFNALTFWAKASTSATLDVAGIGNDNTGTSMYTAEMTALPLTTTWQKFVIPLPLPAKLDAEKGLFYFAEGPEGGLGYQIWMDEVLFEDLATITNPRPAIASQTIDVEVGDPIAVGNGTVTFDVDGSDVVISAMPGYFTFLSSDPGVVSVGGDGVITAVGEGTATLTADLGVVAATGSITVNVSAAAAVPTTPAPTPTPNPADVVSLYSDAYTSATTIDTWSATWDDADVEDFVIGTDSTKKYTNLTFAGIEFTSSTVDVSAMTHFHMDVWTPDPTAAPSVFKVKLVDFGPDGIFGTDDTEHELTFDENTMNTGEWVGIDVPLASFTGLTTKAHLAQMIISGNPNTVYVDNIYFYDAGAVLVPTSPAPTPTVDAGNVVSLYSDAYTPATTVDTWSAVWDDADVEDYLIGSDNTKKYTNLVFAGIEFTSSTVDASAMTHFHMDVWTPDPTGSPAVFKVKLVDFGADGIWGTDDVEHELTFDENTMNTGIWTSIDVPLSSFVNLTTTGHLAQLVISGDPNTVWVDNIYFYNAGPVEPTTAAPTPSYPSSDVISLFSNAYTNVTVDTWSATWDDADVTDVTVSGDDVKKYVNLVFAGIEFTSSTIDASTMTHFSMDIWTPDPTALPAVFKVKLVDFGPDGIWGTDDTEHELFLDAGTTPAIGTGSWVTLDIPLTDFVNLTTTGHMAQLIISGDLSTVFVDNVLFHK